MRHTAGQMRGGSSGGGRGQDLFVAMVGTGSERRCCCIHRQEQPATGAVKWAEDAPPCKFFSTGQPASLSSLVRDADVVDLEQDLGVLAAVLGMVQRLLKLAVQLVPGWGGVGDRMGWGGVGPGGKVGRDRKQMVESARQGPREFALGSSSEPLSKQQCTSCHPAH